MATKHILLTTDLSDEALRAFAPAFALARALAARVTVLHVVVDTPMIPHGAALAPKISAPDLPQRIEEARAVLDEHCAHLAEGIETTCEVIGHEHAARGIVDFARKHDVDLIALSTHGRTGLRRLALGSVAEAVLRHSPIPVLSYHRTGEEN